MWIDLLTHWVPTAVANSNGAASAHVNGPQDMLSSLPMLAVFGLVFYFMLIRPQSKRAKEHKALLDGLQQDDEVVTSGGVLGRVVSINDDWLTLLIASGVEITVQRKAVASALPKGTVNGAMTSK